MLSPTKNRQMAAATANQMSEVRARLRPITLSKSIRRRSITRSCCIERSNIWLLRVESTTPRAMSRLT